MAPQTKKVTGTLPQDESHLAIQCASAFLTVDGSSPTLKSPLAFTTAVTRITMPGKAISVDLAPSVDMQISEDVNFASYTVIPANDEVEFGIGEIDYIYIKGSLAGGTLYFRFNTLV